MTEAIDTLRATPSTAPAPLLSVRNIEVVYDDVILVLRGLSLEVAKGAIVALLGTDRVCRRFEDIAYYLARTGKAEPATWAAAAAAAIRDRADLKRFPFFRGFIQRVVGAKIAEEQQRAAEEHLLALRLQPIDQ